MKTKISSPKKYVKVLGETVKEGTKRHVFLLERKRLLDQNN